MGSRQDKKVIVLVFYPQDDWVIRLFDIFFETYIPEDVSYSYECNTSADLTSDNSLIKRIDEADKNLFFLRVIYPFGITYKTNREVFEENCDFMDNRYGAAFAMLEFTPKTYPEFTEGNYRRVSDILFNEFSELIKLYHEITGETFPFPARKRRGAESDSDSETETEPEKEKEEKQDDVSSEKEEEEKEEPEAKKIKTSEEN